ncbi:hypothetical protein JCM3766R1_006049 [Sporobolomyces carnicolor]
MPAAPSSSELPDHWLIKAEPETRIEKGVDVKFSIDDLERVKVSSWEGVRNHEAKKYLKSQMKRGQLCLFYASNCKVPGVTGIAKVVKEGYPDYNAWDPKHPYYDPKSKEDDPTWFMVDVEFVSRLPRLVPLSLLQHLAKLSTPPEALASYLTPTHLSAIAESALIRRGRLSVQPVEDKFFEAVNLLGEKGGFDDVLSEVKKGKGKMTKSKAKGKVDVDVDDEDIKTEAPSGKRKAAEAAGEEESTSAKQTKKRTSVRAAIQKSVKLETQRGKALKSDDPDQGDDFSEEEKMPTRGSRSRSAKTSSS